MTTPTAPLPDPAQQPAATTSSTPGPSRTGPGAAVSSARAALTKGLTPPKPAPLTQVSGVVTEGVEAGCLVLVSAGTGRVLTLIGGDPTLVRPGANLRVTGRERPDLVSHCQQGSLFEVTAVESR